MSKRLGGKIEDVQFRVKAYNDDGIYARVTYIWLNHAHITAIPWMDRHKIVEETISVYPDLLHLDRDNIFSACVSTYDAWGPNSWVTITMRYEIGGNPTEATLFHKMKCTNTRVPVITFRFTKELKVEFTSHAEFHPYAEIDSLHMPYITKRELDGAKKFIQSEQDKIMERLLKYASSPLKLSENPIVRKALVEMEYGGARKCSQCGEEIFPSYQCRECNKEYCVRHRLPEEHGCEKIPRVRQPDPVLEEPLEQWEGKGESDDIDDRQKQVEPLRRAWELDLKLEKDAPTLLESYIVLGEELKENGQLDEAINLVQEGLAKLDDHYLLQLYLIALYTEKKDFKSALKQLEILLTDHPKLLETIEDSDDYAPLRARPEYRTFVKKPEGES